MVPDVAGNADPNTGYEIILYGASTVVGGTSAVAPLYAGLFASFGTKLGFVTPELYLNSACFHDIIHGDNGAFRGRMGADPCTGLGSPLGEILEERIQPAAIHASRVRGLLAENAQLRVERSAGSTRSLPWLPASSGCLRAAHGYSCASLSFRYSTTCALDGNGMWWKFPVNASGEQIGEGVPAGPGECPLQRTAW